MIIADTNIISTFARVGELDKVRQLVNADRLYVTPATFTELRRAVEAGCDFLEPVLAMIADGRVGSRGVASRRSAGCKKPAGFTGRGRSRVHRRLRESQWGSVAHK